MLHVKAKVFYFEIHKGFTNSNNIFKFSQFTNPNEAKSIKKNAIDSKEDI